MTLQCVVTLCPQSVHIKSQPQRLSLTTWRSEVGTNIIYIYIYIFYQGEMTEVLTYKQTLPQSFLLIKILPETTQISNHTVQINRLIKLFQLLVFNNHMT